MVTFEVVTEIAAPLERCFDLARSIDAHLSTSAATGERVVAGRASGLIEAGEEVTWEAHHLGMRRRMTVRIVRMDRPREFEDRMVRGSFKLFEHIHRFESMGERTRMIDIVRLAAPYGPLGWLAERLLLRGYMHRFIVDRAGELKELAESEGWRAFLKQS